MKKVFASSKVVTRVFPFVDTNRDSGKAGLAQALVLLYVLFRLHEADTMELGRSNVRIISISGDSRREYYVILVCYADAVNF